MQQSISNQSKIPSRSKVSYKPKLPFRSVEGTESPAYKRLSRDAVWVLMEFYRKFDGFNRHCLVLTYKEISDRISSGTFSKAIWELRAFGFMDTIRPGRLERNVSIYAFSNRWKKIKDPKRLDRIEHLLSCAKKVEKIKPPKGLDESKQKEFKQRRRNLVRKIRYELNGA